MFVKNVTFGKENNILSISLEEIKNLFWVSEKDMDFFGVKK